MKFHLNHTPARAGFEIEHEQKLMLSGSCFSEEIGSMLKQHRFYVLSNPDGILFNPLSIFTSLDSALHLKTFLESMLVERDELFFSYLHHSDIHGANKKELLQRIRSTAEKTQEFLWSANFLIITFGSAFVYEHNSLNQAVANCHKQPAQSFTKRLLTVSEIVEKYRSFIEALKNVNPAIKIIFTVSPVKHVADGIHENNLSKSTLLLSINELVSSQQDCHYFPAYELVNDDLRDYRFYKEDLAHPNEQAVNYVWEKFSGCYFSQRTIQVNKQIMRLNNALKHQPLHENSDSSKLNEFISRQRKEVHKLNPTIEI